MQNYKEVQGDLIKMANLGEFDVIAHGCNCFNMQGAGIALAMAKSFRTDELKLEKLKFKGSKEKLGTIDMAKRRSLSGKDLWVVNAYTQYHPGKDLRIEALRKCMQEINKTFPGKHIGLPLIGCGIAGGNWKEVSLIIKEELKDMNVTIVIYNK